MSQDVEQIHVLTWKIFKLMKKRRLKPELNDLLNLTVSELLNEIEKISNLKNSFSWHDLFDLFNAPMKLDIQGELAKVKNKNQLRKYVNKYIFATQDEFNFYFKFGFKADFRNSYQLGDGIFFSLEKLPSSSRRFIKQNMIYERARKDHPTIKDKDWIRIRKRDSYMKINVKAIGT